MATVAMVLYVKEPYWYQKLGLFIVAWFDYDIAVELWLRCTRYKIGNDKEWRALK